MVAAFFQRRFGEQLERVRAALERGSRVHERQVDALLKIHSRLEAALFCVQRAASTIVFEGEDRDELLKRAGTELAGASAEYLRKKLLLSEALIRKLDEFFDAVQSAGTDLWLATDPMMLNSALRTESWQKAKGKAYKELPEILRAIQREATTLIHGSA